jgi:beta-glucanase (GH16 family)
VADESNGENWTPEQIKWYVDGARTAYIAQG